MRWQQLSDNFALLVVSVCHCHNHDDDGDDDDDDDDDDDSDDDDDDDDVKSVRQQPVGLQGVLPRQRESEIILIVPNPRLGKNKLICFNV